MNPKKTATFEPLLNINRLKTYFKLKGNNILKAVDDVSFSLQSAGEIHGLVGESGCGKTITTLSILKLISPPGYIAGGEILWKGTDLVKLNNAEMRRIRGKEIAMIFQNPLASLNPLYTIGNQLIFTLRLHKKISKKDARTQAVDLLKMVKIPDPDKRMDDYPHQLSIGMCQRVMIALALSCNPKLLIADEPTASLDLTIQSQIIDLLLEIREKHQTAILMISHDMGVVAGTCSRISVMYLGRIIEESDAIELYRNPKHPYTQILLESVLVPDPTKKFQAIGIGDPPSPVNLPTGCRFHTRCPKKFDKCENIEPELRDYTLPGSNLASKVACWLYH